MRQTRLIIAAFLTAAPVLLSQAAPTRPKNAVQGPIIVVKKLTTGCGVSGGPKAIKNFGPGSNNIQVQIDAGTYNFFFGGNTTDAPGLVFQFFPVTNGVKGTPLVHSLPASASNTDTVRFTIPPGKWELLINSGPTQSKISSFSVSRCDAGPKGVFKDPKTILKSVETK